MVWVGVWPAPAGAIILSGAAQRWITRQFARHSRLINGFGGTLVGVAIYDLATKWVFLTY